MAKNQDKEKNEYDFDFDQQLRSSCGCADDQILEVIEFAEKTVDDSQIPPASDDGFERLMAEIERRKLVAYSETTAKESAEGTEEKITNFNEESEKRRIRCLGPLLKVALAVAILGSVLAFTAIQAGAKRSYEYEQSKRDSVRNDVAFDNEMNKDAEGELEQAYEDIHNQIGIRVLKLGNRLQGMWYVKTALNNRHATMYFEYNGNRFYILQQVRTEENSYNTLSDRIESESAKGVDSVYNKWLKREIAIEQAVIEGDEKEFSAQIKEENACYYLAGIMDEADFKKIIEDVRFMD